jgi:uncharacterized membrane protein YgcG
MFLPDFFTSKDVDLLITFGGTEFDERWKLPMQAARITNQMTGATRFHVSEYDQTFAVGGDGAIQFVDQRNGESPISRTYRINVVKNWWKWNGRRFLFTEIVVLLGFGGVCMLNVMSKKSAMDCVFLIERFFGRLLQVAGG